LGHLFFLLDSVFWSNQNLLEDDGLFYPSKDPRIYSSIRTLLK
jgi:hypothetical protein